MAPTVSDIFRMKFPGKVSSPRQRTGRVELLIGRIQTNTGVDHLLPVAGGDATGSINFS
jgi:hypothetical protein